MAQIRGHSPYWTVGGRRCCQKADNLSDGYLSVVNKPPPGALRLISLKTRMLSLLTFRHKSAHSPFRRYSSAPALQSPNSGKRSSNTSPSNDPSWSVGSDVCPKTAPRGPRARNELRMSPFRYIGRHEPTPAGPTKPPRGPPHPPVVQALTELGS